MGNTEDGIYCHSSSPTITNNTIVGNGGNGVYSRYGSPTITNNIVAFNTTGIRSSEVAAPVLSHNDVYGNWTDYDGISPGVGDISEDPEFACWETGDLHIQPTSPCRNAGDNSAPGLPDEDMDGQARDDGGGVDIGADESYGEQWPPCSDPRIIHVDGSASPGGDGTSWATAHQRIGDAVDDVRLNGPAEIWVAEGAYNEHVALVPFAYMYGGFAGTETARDQRDWEQNVSIIDGGGAGSVVTGANISTIDGFTIKNGSYGIYCYSSSPTITNNTVVGNSDDGISCSRSCATITNNVVVGNSDGIYCHSASSPTITNNMILGNSSYGIYCASSSPTVTNNTITGNAKDGIDCASSSPAITNNTIVGNSGAGISCYGFSLSPGVANNVVAFNSSGIYRSGGTPALRNNCVYGNTDYDYFGSSPGTGDISLDPLFVDWPGGDYHLTVVSPCISAGWNDASGLPSTDMDEEPRIQGGTVDIGADECWLSAATVREAKLAADNVLVDLSTAIVAGAFPDFFYIEVDDRSSGIRVEKAGHGMSEGMRADVEGSIETNSDGERYIAAATVSPGGSGSVAPVGLNNISLGGGDWFYNESTGAGQKGVAGGCGLNNIGLLIRTWGKVTYADADYFYLEDGSLLDDGSGNVGVKVLAEGLILPAQDSYVQVTGISSCFKVGDDLHPLIRVRDSADIVVLE